MDMFKSYISALNNDQIVDLINCLSIELASRDNLHKDLSNDKPFEFLYTKKYDIKMYQLTGLQKFQICKMSEEYIINYFVLALDLDYSNNLVGMIIDEANKKYNPNPFSIILENAVGKGVIVKKFIEGLRKSNEGFAMKLFIYLN